DLLLELARGPAGDLGRDGIEAGWEARRADVVELSLQVGVLLGSRLVLDHLLAEPVDLPAERRILRLRVDEARKPAVAVPERACNALGAHLERPQHRGAAALH